MLQRLLRKRMILVIVPRYSIHQFLWCDFGASSLCGWVMEENDFTRVAVFVGSSAVPVLLRRSVNSPRSPLRPRLLQTHDRLWSKRAKAVPLVAASAAAPC
ncbi:hypothetical protein ACTHPH_04035 [Paenibacillus pasadenensis]|uniref:Uncharacterized protein n=1 Tax=Paenibacillus pasadenensis TaxID=217090 RepID=A0A2N5N244_9BACL|nr:MULTISPECIES: hypothetical protein [Paenibacillus]PLT44411.1 hypothetical protein B8V81_2842 [Paenibacillus pasadenensis]QGG54895.1 hypothetical protein GE073_04370 [Paenibacillus sp. B01]